MIERKTLSKKNANSTITKIISFYFVLKVLKNVNIKKKCLLHARKKPPPMFRARDINLKKFNEIEIL